MALIPASSVVGGSPKNVTDLLSAEYDVPAYQRDFVWQARTVKQLWDDLIEHYRRNASAEQLPSPEGYFLGAMVVIEHAEDKPLEVVDGQQRLTTLSTIASVLLDKLEMLPADDQRRGGYEQRLTGMLARFDGQQWNSNLRFTDEDLQRFFLESCKGKTTWNEKQAYWGSDWCVQRLSKRKSPIARVREAIDCGYETFNMFLNDQPDPALKIARLSSFVRLVTEAVVVLRITAKSYKNAYSIFESLNNRGVPLSQADLIKNELLKVAPPFDRGDITENWTAVRQHVDAFESVQLPELLHFSYLSRYGRVKAKELYVAAKGKFVGSQGGYSKRYSEDLLSDAEALDALTENFRSTWTPETNNMLKDIKNVLGVKLCYPFLIAAFRKHQANSQLFESHVKAVMNFVFRYMKVLEGNIEALAGIISDASSLVNDGKPLNEIRDLFRNHATDMDFAKEFESVSLPNTKLAYFAVYYLEKVQMAGAIPIEHGLDQNLEHIMPKSPTSKDWPDALAEKTNNPDGFKDYLWRVGNLLPLPATINKSIKNRGIKYKIKNSTKNHYNAPSLALLSPKSVTQFVVKRRWTHSSIEKRQKDLAKKFAVSAWAL
jgi:hypothetical protein